MTTTKISNRQKSLNFRYYDTELKSFIYSTEFNIGNEFEKLSAFFLKASLYAKDGVQQGTGVKDKSGTEIYEGDIVKTDTDHFSSLSVDNVEYTEGIVTWLRESWCVCQKNVGGNEMSNYVTCDCCPCGLEIIGNVYEGIKTK